jgi:hypothetical protein
MADDIQSAVDTAGLGLDKQLATRAKMFEGEESKALKAQSEAFDRQRKVTTEEARLTREKGAAMEPAQDKLLETSKKAPDPTKIKEEAIPKYERPIINTEEVKTNFGMLMAASMLMGIASRNPYMNTMTAMTGALNGPELLGPDRTRDAGSLRSRLIHAYTRQFRIGISAPGQEGIISLPRQMKDGVAHYDPAFISGRMSKQISS